MKKLVVNIFALLCCIVLMLTLCSCMSSTTNLELKQEVQANEEIKTYKYGDYFEIVATNGTFHIYREIRTDVMHIRYSEKTVMLVWVV